MRKKLFAIVFILLLLLGCISCSHMPDEPTIIVDGNENSSASMADTGEGSIDEITTELPTAEEIESQSTEETESTQGTPPIDENSLGADSPYITPEPYPEATPIEDFEYALNDDGITITIKKYKGTIDVDSVVIPAEIDGKSVTIIGEKAFFYGFFISHPTILSITIPDSVTSIGRRTFYNCDSLKSVTLPSSLVNIDDYAFGGCIHLPEETRQKINQINRYAFMLAEPPI